MSPPPTLPKLLPHYLPVKLVIALTVAICQQLGKVIINKLCSSPPKPTILRLTTSEKKLILSVTLTEEAADTAPKKDGALDLAVKASMDAEEARRRVRAEKMCWFCLLSSFFSLSLRKNDDAGAGVKDDAEAGVKDDAETGVKDEKDDSHDTEAGVSVQKDDAKAGVKDDAETGVKDEKDDSHDTEAGVSVQKDDD